MTYNLHAGHRARMKEDFLERGFDKNTPPHKILEILLFFCIKQTDTNVLAHELIDRYKTLYGVLDAPVEELIQFRGLTRSNVVLLKLIMPVSRIYYLEKNNSKADFNSLEDIGKFMLTQFLGRSEEALGILCLSADCKKRAFDFVATGDISSVGVSTRSIIKLVLDAGASAIVMAHNHPGGIALPSGNDITVTKSIAEALSHIGVRLLDHMIIANNDYISMTQSSEYACIFH